MSEAMRIWKTSKSPHKGFIRDLELSPEGYYTVIVYSDNFNTFSPEHQADIVQFLHDLMFQLNAAGLPCVLESRPYCDRPEVKEVI